MILSKLTGGDSTMSRTKGIPNVTQPGNGHGVLQSLGASVS